MKNKIIFLDIDGVLNTEVFVRCYLQTLKHIGEIKGESFMKKELSDIIPHDHFGALFCPVSCGFLEHIIQETKADIVISSTWRFSGLKHIRELWEHRNLPGNVIDVTPHMRSNSINEIDLSFKERAERGNEIKEWMKRNDFTGNYVIIDDDDDVLPEQESHFIQTNHMYGITFDHATDSINILNDEE